MNNQDNIQNFNGLMSQEENNSKNNMDLNKYNRSNVNYNVTLSNPNLNINNSMSLNIKDNINNSTGNKAPLQTDSIINETNNQSIDNSNNNQMLYNADVDNNQNIDSEINEKKDLMNSNLDQTNLINNYERNDINNNVVYNEHNNYNKAKYNNKKGFNSNNNELKFMFLISLIMFIIIMFFPNIRNFISNLFNN